MQAVVGRRRGGERGAKGLGRGTALAFGLLGLLGLLLAACSRTVYPAQFSRPSEPEKLDVGAEFLKCHLRDGTVYVLMKWHVDIPSRVVSGRGLRYDRERSGPGVDGDHQVSLDDVVLFETNRPEKISHPEVTTMVVVTAASLLVTTFCLANPKACFGSCPTFYASDGEREVLQAEGFSASAARVLEATDVDAMWTARPSGTTFDVRMANEALETHSVDHVRLLAVPRAPGTRVLRSGGTYVTATSLHAPTSCASPLGSCLDASRAFDGVEYHSPASDRDLAERETIELSFPRAHGELGLAIVARNSLLNTFVFYQLLAYMGGQAGEWFARMEREGPESVSVDRFVALLGDIEVSTWTSSGWQRAGSFAEVGPIAHEAQLVRLPHDLEGSEVRVRLTLTRGNWKIDQVALAELGATVTPIAIEPSEVLRSGRPAPEARAALLRPGAHLVTQPGEDYTLRFHLPAGESELFLESRGYYYEWIRQEWLAEESPFEALRAVLDPEGTLRRLAPKYKAVEGTMEETFWRSKFRRQP
jgi:hypothetical protein